MSKSMTHRVECGGTFFLQKRVDQTLTEPTLDELLCFLPKESISFLGDHTFLNENLKIILLIF